MDFYTRKRNTIHENAFIQSLERPGDPGSRQRVFKFLLYTAPKPMKTGGFFFPATTVIFLTYKRLEASCPIGQTLALCRRFANFYKANLRHILCPVFS
jgi:hypothetical protein